MKLKFAHVLACAAVLCAAAGVTSLQSAEGWLSEVPPLPATAEGAYAQWADVSGVLKPGPASERVKDGIKAQVLTLSRSVQPAAGGAGQLSAHDQVLVGKISVFPDTAALLQKIQSARTEQATMLQKWHAELNALEQKRVRARSALPACHNEAGVGVPSQQAIRDVELSFVQQRIEIAVRYLAESQPLFAKLLAAVSPRIEHGDAAMAAWNGLRNPGKKAELALVARGSLSDALLDVALVQSYIQDISKLAARPIADRNAIRRVYAQAKGC